MTAPRPLLQQRDFRFLLGSRLTSNLGISALITVVGFQVYDITKDPLALGWLGLVEAIPALSLSLFGGHLADLYDRRTIVVSTGLVMTCARSLCPCRADGSLGCCRSSP